MSDPFAAYAKKAQSLVDAPAKLIGPIKTRAEAKVRYSAIEASLRGCASMEALNSFLASVSAELLQFRTELPLFWEGDGDFAGLQREIERAQVRLDDGLDHPRYEDKDQEA